MLQRKIVISNHDLMKEPKPTGFRLLGFNNLHMKCASPGKTFPIDVKPQSANLGKMEP